VSDTTGDDQRTKAGNKIIPYRINMLKGKKILLGITGSIAAYKAILLVRLLAKAGAEVKVIMTDAAKSFVSPLVLSTLSNNKVLADLFDEDTWANHVMLGRWADVMLIAPLSCNTLAKMANGQCDNLLLAVYLSAACPVVVSPAMDEDMWHHPSTKRNIELLQSYGNSVIDVEKGELASGLIGEGRMAEPETIVHYLTEHFFRSSALKGKKVLITAGPTYEAIDPVRFIGNHSSGKMGFALAEAFYLKGAEVNIVTGPTNQHTVYNGINIIKITSAEEMYQQCISVFPSSDIAVMSAAVADYTPLEVAAEKIKKTEEDLTIQLSKTKDILKSLGQQKKNGQLLVGFALETNNEREYAIKKMQTKNADMIVLNSLRDKNAGFGHDTNKVTIFDKEGNEFVLNLASKQSIAADIVKIIIQKINA
jgi:phosphopantothenoylcysteine decarboxylase / phosphopantothenate---cysteine ligase